jgi:hypothetical protein
LYSYNVDAKYAIFTWFERTVRMIVKLGKKLEIKRSRKSMGRCVTHFTIDSIHLGATDPEVMQDSALDTALHLLTKNMSNEMLSSRCPNTHSLKSLLSEVSDMMSQTIDLYRSLKYVKENFVTTINNNIVTVDFSSPGLGASFKLLIDYSEGLAEALSSIQIQPKPWNTNDLAIIRKKMKNLPTASPQFVEILCSTIWSTIQHCEAELKFK